MRITAELLHEQVEAWQEVALPLERARSIEADTNRFNEAAMAVAADMAFEAEPGTFRRVLDAHAED